MNLKIPPWFVAKEFKQAAMKYYRLFGEWPPVHEVSKWPIPRDSLEMITRANERGSKITKKDYPYVDPDIDVN